MKVDTIIDYLKAHYSSRQSGSLTTTVRTLYQVQTHAYAGCGRPTLNFIERFDLSRLGSLRSDSEATQSPRVVGRFIRLAGHVV